MDAGVETKLTHDDGGLWVVMLCSQSNHLVEHLGHEGSGSDERPQQLVRGLPARAEQDGSLLVFIVDRVCFSCSANISHSSDAPFNSGIRPWKAVVVASLSSSPIVVT